MHACLCVCMCACTDIAQNELILMWTCQCSGHLKIIPSTHTRTQTCACIHGNIHFEPCLFAVLKWYESVCVHMHRSMCACMHACVCVCVCTDILQNEMICGHASIVDT